MKILDSMVMDYLKLIFYLKNPLIVIFNNISDNPENFNSGQN
ncbi:MAG TPA: hypothetical protein PL110_14855 [Candidatus Eremiobacteraeota bacterium]|nr:hypothetical protein [Candidatus Eremiobacteraeota bacterium]